MKKLMASILVVLMIAALAAESTISMEELK